MSEWICPACGGGFPTDALKQDTACPWCEFMLGEAADLREADHFNAEAAFETNPKHE
jgi:hypothetical protein